MKWIGGKNVWAAHKYPLEKGLLLNEICYPQRAVLWTGIVFWRFGMGFFWRPSK
jgi:hypothetical protein